MVLSYVKVLFGFLTMLNYCWQLGLCRIALNDLIKDNGSDNQKNNSLAGLKNCYFLIKKTVYYCVTQFLFKPLHLNRVKAVFIRKK